MKVTKLQFTIIPAFHSKKIRIRKKEEKKRRKVKEERNEEEKDLVKRN